MRFLTPAPKCVCLALASCMFSATALAQEGDPFSDALAPANAEDVIDKALIAPDEDALQAKPKVGRAPARERIEAALAETTKLDFVETPLEEVAAYLADYHRVMVRVDLRVLDDAGIDASVPMTKTISQATLGAALDQLLGEVGLSYVIQNEALLITTREAAEARPAIELYSLEKMTTGGWDIETIRRVVNMQTRAESEVLGTHLAILQSQPAHRRTAALMDRLNAAAIGGETKDAEVVRRVEGALAAETKFDFTETPLSDVCAYINDYHKLPIAIHLRAFEDAGMGSDIPVTDRSIGVSLGAALESMLSAMGSTYILQDETLLITTQEAARARPEVHLYSLQPLLDCGWSPVLVQRVVAMQAKCECELLGHYLAIHQSLPAHRRTAELIADLEAAARGER